MTNLGTDQIVNSSLALPDVSSKGENAMRKDLQTRESKLFLLARLVVMTVVVTYPRVAVGQNWAHTWGGPASDSTEAVTLDASGNIYAAGATGSYGAGGQDVLILKYSPAGTLLWAKTWGGTGNEYAASIAFGPDGFLYVTGGTSSFGAGWYDMFLLKLDTDGNLQGGTTWGGASYDVGHDLGFDSLGNIYLVGETYSYGPCCSSAILMKFSPSGGSPLWTALWKDSATYDGGYSLAVDSAGNIIITGISWDYTVNPNHNYILLVKFDASGNYLWSENWFTPIPGQDGSWAFRDVTTDNAGNIYVGGYHSAQCQNPDFTQCTFDAMVLKFDSGGNFQWANTWGGPGNSQAASVAIDPTGHLLFTGIEDQFGPSPTPFVLTYDTDGNLLSSIGWLAPQPLSPWQISGMILDGVGNVYYADEAQNNSGAWGSISEPTGVLPNLLVYPAYSLGAPVGQQSSLTNPTQLQTGGVIDTGGGGADAFVAKIAPLASGRAMLVSPANLCFVNQPVGIQSQPQTALLTNIGTATVSISGISMTGPNAGQFAQANNCGTAIAAGMSCTIGITFTPSAAGSASAALTVTDDASNSPQTVSLSGTGVTLASGTPLASLTATDLFFGFEIRGGEASPQTVTLTNSGTATPTINSISITPSTANFGETDNCIPQGASSGSLASKASCAINVTFSPSSSSSFGYGSGTLTIADNTAKGSETVSLEAYVIASYNQCETDANLPDSGWYDGGKCSTCKYGCALTSFSDAMTAVNSAVTPALMDQYLTQQQSYTDCEMVAGDVPSYMSSINSPVQIDQGKQLDPTDVDGYLNYHLITQRESVVLQLCYYLGNGPCSTTCDANGKNCAYNNTHFIVALGQNGSSDWQVFDPYPWLNPVPSSSVATLSGHLQGFTENGKDIHFQVIGARAFILPTPDAMSLSVEADSPVELLITDPESRQLGFTQNGADLFEIPLGSYTRDFPIADDTNVGPSIGDSTGIKDAYVPDPLEGAYTVTMTGTASGSYSLRFQGVATDGSAQSTTITGTTLPGTFSTYQVSYTSTPGLPFTVTKIPTGPQAVLSSSGLAFAGQLVNSTSAPQGITLSNPGDSALTITGIAVNGDFAEANACASSLAGGANCTINVTFTPVATGTRTGTLTVYDNAASTPQMVALSGTGLAPMASLSSPSLTFTGQGVDTTSATQSVILSNTGSASMTIAGITIAGPDAGDFSQTNTCGSWVNAGANCTINVTFTPTATGSRAGTLTVTDGAGNSPQTVSLTGTGTAPNVSLSTTSVSFSNQSVGTTSAASAVTVTNNGTAPLTFTSIAATGDFAVAASGTTCSTSAPVAAGSNCVINVTFSPSANGARSGSLALTDNAMSSPQTVSLSGTGTEPVVSLSSPLSFSAQIVGTASSSQTVTLTNAGNANLTLTAMGATGPFAIASSGTTCSTSNPVAGPGSCTVAVTFTPTAGGAASGSLSFTDNAPNSPQTIALSGTGQDFSFAPPSGSSTSATVAPGSPATYTLSVGGEGGLSGAVNFTCAGAPSEATCTVSPNPATAGSSATNVTVTVTTTAPSVTAPRTRPLPPVAPLSPGMRGLWLLAWALATLVWVIRRRNQPSMSAWRSAMLPLATGLLLILALAACGGGGCTGGGPPPNPGTPAGTYPLTVTGTAGSGASALSHSVKLTLTVS
jgi:hypothetical protein